MTLQQWADFAAQLDDNPLFAAAQIGRKAGVEMAKPGSGFEFASNISSQDTKRLITLFRISEVSKEAGMDSSGIILLLLLAYALGYRSQRIEEPIP